MNVTRAHVVRDSAAPAPRSLIRGIGRWSAVALVTNGIIGAGIFGLPSRIHAVVGASAIVEWVLCAVVVAAIGLCFAEVSSRFTLTGGPYLYAWTAFGPLIGFLIGWVMWIARVTALAAISGVMASYLAFFWAPAAAGAGRAAVVTAVLVVLTMVNLVGVRRSAMTMNALTIGKLIPLVLFVTVGLFSLDARAFAAPQTQAPGAFAKAALLMIFAFSGFEGAVVATGEMKDPPRDAPFSLLSSIALAALLYLAIQVVCIGTLPALATSEKPLADASVRFMGPLGGSLIALGALISTIGTLCASLLIGPRLLFAMSERNQLPGAFGHVHRDFHTPDLAIVATAGAGIALALSGTFTYVVSLSVIARLATYVATAGAVMQLRRRNREPAPFSMRGGAIVAVVSLASCVWLLSRCGARELRDFAIAVAVGLGIHLLDRWGRASRAGRAAG